MPDDVTTAASTEQPTGGGEALVDTPGVTGVSEEDRFTGFLNILENGPDKTTQDDEPVKPAEEKKEPEAKVEEKVEPEKKVEAVKGPDTEEPDEDEGDTLELLSDEEIDKRFPNSPKGLRAYAKAQAKRYQPVVEAVEALGGVEAVKRLDSTASLVLSQPARPDAPEVTEYIQSLNKTNPQFAKMLQTNVFYGAIDENPELLERVIKANLGEMFSGEKLRQIAELVKTGELDLDEIQEVANKKLPPEELVRREAQAAADKKRDDEIAELRKGQTDRDAEQKQTAIAADVDALQKTFSEAREPVWKRLKLLPVDGEPDDIKKVKEQVIKEIILESSYELNMNPLFQSINGMVNSQAKGDGYQWATVKAANALKAKTLEVGLRKLPLITAYLKQYNQPAAANVSTRRPEPLADGSLASPRDLPTNEAQKEPLTAEERRAGFQRMVEGKTGT